MPFHLALEESQVLQTFRALGKKTSAASPKREEKMLLLALVQPIKFVTPSLIKGYAV